MTAANTLGCSLQYEISCNLQIWDKHTRNSPMAEGPVPAWVQSIAKKKKKISWVCRFEYQRLLCKAI